MSTTEPSVESPGIPVIWKDWKEEPDYLMYDSSIESYERSFESVLKGKKIVDILSEKESPVVLDLMAPPGTLDSLFKKLPKEKKRFGLAVTLKDLRTSEAKEEDRSIGVEQIAGDILTVGVWNNIEKKLAGRKADLIMERAQQGLVEMYFKSPRVDSKKFMAYLFKKLWTLLSPNNGVLLLQVFPDNLMRIMSKNLGIDIADWVAKLNSQKINAVFDRDEVFKDWSLMLTKTPESPRELPLPDTKVMGGLK